MTITDFLLARIAEDEAGAAGMEANRRRMSYCGESHNVEIRREPFGTVRWIDSARVLAECQAKRAIIALHTYEWMGPDDAAAKGCEHDYEDWPCPTLRHLATVYADHPDYRQEWRP